jgi:hypothetical protein
MVSMAEVSSPGPRFSPGGLTSASACMYVSPVPYGWRRAATVRPR